MTISCNKKSGFNLIALYARATAGITAPKADTDVRRGLHGRCARAGGCENRGHQASA
jgi:hypothetical protein